MTEYESQSLAKLDEIIALLKTRPQATAARSSSRQTDAHTGGLLAPDAEWANFRWPDFTNKKGNRRAVTIGESVTSNFGLDDLKWWEANYQPKPYKGQIQQKDVDFRDALDAAKAWLDTQTMPARPQSSRPTPPARSGPKEGPDGSVDTSDATDIPPF